MLEFLQDAWVEPSGPGELVLFVLLVPAGFARSHCNFKRIHRDPWKEGNPEKKCCSIRACDKTQ